MRFISYFLMIFLAQGSIAATQYRVFVSFSMPEQLLQETISYAAKHQIPVVLNGFYHDSMQETAVKIFELSKRIPNLSLQIDPPAFERYGIKQVPALVADNNHSFDVIFGNITIERGLEEISRFGDTGRMRS